MYGLVSSDHSKAQPQPHPHQHERRGNRNNKSICLRLLDFIKDAWTDVKFALESDLEDVEAPPRYRPESLHHLSQVTRFTEREIKRIYRGFKAECPSGVVQQETLCDIYSQFFPQGANTGHYAQYFFNTFDQRRRGIISFEEFVQGLSILSRGTLQEKLRWTFSLYDINGDGCITRDEMKEVVKAIFELMGHCAEPVVEEGAVEERVDWIFQKMDRNVDGMVTMDDYLDFCSKDENISTSMSIFDSII
ncbi:unnamed protein product [Allacma fusca]|uniref:EF-hand domain-containing protein n=1 Tax=Allacma fusca TaxID=39272 RepID=A0A8J2K981_9HEXA|nr:unnamed protein product [Allacma fusca]